MMEFWSTTWGDIFAVAGVIASLSALGWAIWEAHGARTASKAAEAAANEMKDQIARHLQTVDLQKAIGLVERIKNLHDDDRWEVSKEHYQALTAILSDIARSPDTQDSVRESLATLRTMVRDMDNLVRRRLGQSIAVDDKSRFNRVLNQIQSQLEEMASATRFGEKQREIA